MAAMPAMAMDDGIEEEMAKGIIIERIRRNDPTLGINVALLNKNLGDHGAILVSEALKQNYVVQEINLHTNSIREEGAKALSEALKQNNTVKYIHLWDNNIGDEGAKALSEALEQNTTLKSIDLSINDIGDKGVKALSEALMHNDTLQVIGLGYNSIGTEGAKALSATLKQNKALRGIHLESNSIGDEGAKALSEALPQNNTLGGLDLSGNNIKWEGFRALNGALKNWNGTLTVLILQDNPGYHSDDGIKKEVKELLKRNKQRKRPTKPAGTGSTPPVTTLTKRKKEAAWIRRGGEESQRQMEGAESKDGEDGAAEQICMLPVAERRNADRISPNIEDRKMKVRCLFSFFLF